VVDTETFAPVERHDARVAAGLPADVPIVLFLSSAGITDHRKGWDLLAQAMPAVLAQHPTAVVAVAGPQPRADSMPTSLPIQWLGEVRGNQALRDLYASANVVVVPSREDNLPLTAMEAHSVGIPVAAFAIGGLPDIVIDGKTGVLAQPFDTAELAAGITRLLGSEGSSFGAHARSHAMHTWSPKVVVQQYQEVYQQLLA
jgi:glycosyltransferase involved in cell wall biosynthesis